MNEMQITHKAKTYAGDHRWIEGVYYSKTNKEFEVEEHYILQEEMDVSEPVESSGIPVDPDTLRRCSGIKDINGIYIYDGDFIKHYYDPDNSALYDLCLVFWNSRSASFSCASQLHEDMVPIWHTEKYEIVGNVTDNPEMRDNISLENTSNIRTHITGLLVELFDRCDEIKEHITQDPKCVSLIKEISDYASLMSAYREKSVSMYRSCENLTSEACFQKMTVLTTVPTLKSKIYPAVLLMPIISEKIENERKKLQ